MNMLKPSKEKVCSLTAFSKRDGLKLGLFFVTIQNFWQQLHEFMADINTHRMNSNENVQFYWTIADHIKFNSTLVNKFVSEKMFISIKLEGLPEETNNLTSSESFSKIAKCLEINRQCIINFELEKVCKEMRVYSAVEKNVPIFRRQEIWLKIVDTRKQLKSKQGRARLSVLKVVGKSSSPNSVRSWNKWKN